MLEQNRSLSLSEVLNQFRPVEAPSKAPGGNGFQALLDSALAAGPKVDSTPYQATTEQTSFSPLAEQNKTTPTEQAADQRMAEPKPEPARDNQNNVKHSTEKQSQSESLATQQAAAKEPAPLSNKQGTPQDPISKGLESVLRNTRDAREIPAKPKAETQDSNKIVNFDRRSSGESSGRDPGAEQIRSSLGTLLNAVKNAGIEKADRSTKETPEAQVLDSKAKAALKKAVSLVNARHPDGSQPGDGGLNMSLSFAQVKTPVFQGQYSKADPVRNETAQANQAKLSAVSLKASEGLEGKAVNDAMKLVKELSGKLGMALGKDAQVSSDSTEKKIDLLNDKRFGRLELLRRERLGLGDEGRRTEIQNVSRIQGPAETAAQNQVLTGLKSVRVEDASASASAARDGNFYNPTMPQAIMHHTISLPGSVAPTEANFAQVLKTQLRESLNNQVVGQAKILLDGADKGEIKLILHPESLGEVKIHLKLEENAIGGKIFVENKEVLEVFRDNMADLREAFLQGGLDASALELGVSDFGSSGNGGFARDRREDKNFVQYAADALGESVPVIRFQDSGNSLIDVVV